MRAYVIDEINDQDREAIAGYLADNALPSSLPDIFWLPLPDNLLTPVQTSHQACRPLVCAVELEPRAVKLELLVRSRQRISCTCTAYCTSPQREFVFAFAERMLQALAIRT